MNIKLLNPISQQDHMLGPKTAPFSLVEYGDFECRSTANAYPIVKLLIHELGDQLQVVYRHFPRWGKNLHALHAAETAEVAALENMFWDMHDMLMENHTQLTDVDLMAYCRQLGLNPHDLKQHLERQTFAQVVVSDHKNGIENGVCGTPTFFINGTLYEGEIDVDIMLRVITAGR